MGGKTLRMAASLLMLAVGLVLTTSPSPSRSAGEPERDAAAAAPTLALDRFTRTVVGGWGSADVGGAWSPGAAAQTSLLTVAGGAGKMSFPAAGSRAAVSLPELADRDTATYATLATDKAATGGAILAFVTARGGAAGDYRLRARIVDGSVYLSTRKANSTGSETVIGSEKVVPNLVHTAGQRIRVRFEVSGADPVELRARAWAVGGAEPNLWLLSELDTTPGLDGAGRVGLIASVPGAVTNAPIAFSFDDLEVYALDAPPTARIAFDCSRRACDFDASDSTDDRGIARYSWNFGDGTVVADGPARIQHRYGRGGGVGGYDVTLTVTDGRGQRDAVVARDVNGAPQPNIVVVMTDDQALADMRVMPKTRRVLGGLGTNFQNAFVSYPLCCPSRATFLTGQYSHNHHVDDNAPPFGGYAALDHTNTLPVWLDEVGYRTSFIGKYMNGYSEERRTEIPPGWDDFQVLANGSAYRMYDYVINDNGTLVSYGTTAADYQTDVLTNRATAEIRRASNSDRPFMMWLSPTAPHTEWYDNTNHPPRPAPRHLGAFANEPLPRNPNFNEADVSDKPRHVRSLPLLDAAAIARDTEMYRARLASLLAVDDMVERVVNTLDQAGELDNTYIVFTSDNGFFLGEHRIELGKIRPYQEATRVPLYVRGPGVSMGATVGNLTVNPDLIATFVDRAHATPGRALDGMSLDDVADNGRGDNRAVLFENYAPGVFNRYADAIRTERYVYTEWVYSDGLREAELYDLAADPYELQNRANDPAFATIRESLRTRLTELRDCVGSECTVRYP